MSGRAAAYDDTGRCAYHLAPFGCTLVDGDADGPGLIELHGHKPEDQSGGTPDVRAGLLTQPTGPRPSDAPSAAEPSAEVHKRSANPITWCERRTIGIHFYCANNHAFGHSGDHHIGNYGRRTLRRSPFFATIAGRLTNLTWTRATRKRSKATPTPSDTPTASDGDGPAA